MGENHSFSFESPALIANFIVVRKSSISVELLKEWLTACSKEEWINGEQYGELDSQFKHSTPEQSLLSVIIYNWIRERKYNIPLQYPFISFQGRNIKKIKYNYDFSHLNLIKSSHYEIMSIPNYMGKLNFINLRHYCAALIKNWYYRKCYRILKFRYSLHKNSYSLKNKMLWYKEKLDQC